ncbi:hypothetical protein [Streptomyces sp. NPDC060194]
MTEPQLTEAERVAALQQEAAAEYASAQAARTAQDHRDDVHLHGPDGH